MLFLTLLHRTLPTQGRALLFGAFLAMGCDGDAPTGGADDVNAGARDATPDEALRSGDSTRVSEADLIAAAIRECQRLAAEREAILDAVLGTEAVAYNPGAGSQLVQLRGDRNAHFHALIVGNGGETLAGAGYLGESRVLAFGASPSDWQGAGSAADLGGIAQRALTWLGTGVSASHIALFRFGGRAEGMLSWIADVLPEAVVTECDDDLLAEECLAEADVALIGGELGGDADSTAIMNDALSQALRAAIGNGIGVGYFHTGGWGEGSSAWVGDLLGFEMPYAGNFFSEDSASWESRAAMVSAAGVVAAPDDGILRALLHLQARDYAFDWSPCDSRTCEEVSGLRPEFLDGAEAVQRRISGLEESGREIFDDMTPRLLRLLVLVGDKVREGVHFPIDKAGDTNGFLRAIWSDYSLATRRSRNPALDLAGSSFSPVIPGRTAVATVTRRMKTRGVEFTASSATYALPGRAFEVTRKDSGTAEVRVFVNMIRFGANHAFDGEAYDRPMFLWGNAIPLTTGNPVVLASATGGIVYVEISSSESGEDVELEFRDVGLHAAFSGGDADTFTRSLEDTPFGWAELLTPGFEVHSTTEKMRESVAAYGGDAERLSADTWKYLYQNVYGLAGFLGTDLSHSAEVRAFCEEKGWDCENSKVHGLAGVQHFNADQANCGSLCSGQPIDSYGAFKPSGWGEAHEIGHNLQYGEFRIYDGASSEVSNNIFPTYVWLKWNADHPSEPAGRDLRQAETFQILQEAQLEADPSAYVQTRLWNDEDLFWGRLLFYWQAVLTSQDVPSLGDGGWDLYRLMYLNARLRQVARKDEATWANNRAALGFSSDDYADPSAEVSSNDYFLIVMSLITGRDQRPFFDEWGVTYSDTARAQVAEFGFPEAKKRFFVVPCVENAFGPPLAEAYPVDGLTAWPAEGSCVN